MTAHQRLLDWLDDLCVRFIVNAPHEELQSVERICFQLEEAQWFYEDFIRPLDPGLPGMNLRVFAQRMFAHCPLFASFSAQHAEEAYETFIQYKTRVPVRGAIMLNQAMTHAVLVKGWKKGAKWSFPRGKINKEEKDLDCAIREVYEETGFDLRESGLVPPEDEVKSISVNMHQQNVMLFIFRGVPMETHFEPRTRKEISKIDWYKLGDLPHLKNKNKVQQGDGQDLVKDNSFYMVGPFIGQLKGWIKTQKRLDRSKAPAGQYLAPPPATGATDTEEVDVDLGETTADEAGMPESVPSDQNFAQLVAQLGRTQRSSDALPEVSMQSQTETIVDPAAELKRLLSVGGGGIPSQGSTSEAPANPLLAMLHGNNRPAPPPESMPRTPFEQLIPTPQPPQSPHGQHHPRPPHYDQMGPPPPFPFHGPHGMPFGGPQYPSIPPPQHNGFHGPPPHQFAPPPPHMNPNFARYPPNMQQQQQQHFNQQPPRPMEQTGNTLFSQSPQHHGPQGPPASKLPAPKLTAHTLGLLNAFKLNEKPAISSPQGPSQHEQSFQSASNPPPPPPQQQQYQQQQPPSLQRSFDSFTSPPVQSAQPYAPSPPAFQSPPPQANFHPAQPKPRNPHQDSLLNLFRSPSMTAATPALQMTPEQPAELSALPSTPGYARMSAASNPGPPVPNLKTKPNDFLDSFQAYSLQQKQNRPNAQPNKPGQTSATVRGPVNAPDFETVKKNSHSQNGNSRGPSPALPKPEQKVFMPQQILKRDHVVQSPSVELSASATSSPLTVVPPTATFKPQILKRPESGGPLAPAPVSAAHSQGLLNLFKSPSPRPPQPSAPVSAAHSQGLLNLFKSPSPTPPQPSAPVSAAHSQGLLNLFKSPSPTPPQPSAPMSISSRSPHQQGLLDQFKNQTATEPQSVAAPNIQSAASAPSAQSQDLLSLFKGPAAPQAAPAAATNMPPPLTQVPSRSADQKNTLLSLFGNSHANSPTFSSKSPLPTPPMPPARSPQPPTPKTQMSGIISPVSPLPTEKGSQTGSPAQFGSRSRISSLGEGGLPNIVIPRSEPASGLGSQRNGVEIGGGMSLEDGNASAAPSALGELGIMDKGKGKLAASGGSDTSGGKSPVDKNFLLGFLNDVARQGR